ncbi:MAG TPA: hypothetical protein VJ697_04565 [Nitrososphaeraceae archaeon]|nr:hypothetical protein [Nitrososphaeraceae archaeon]
MLTRIYFLLILLFQNFEAGDTGTNTEEAKEKYRKEGMTKVKTFFLFDFNLCTNIKYT